LPASFVDSTSSLAGLSSVSETLSGNSGGSSSSSTLASSLNINQRVKTS